MALSFPDVTWNGYRGAPHLTGQAIEFFLGKP